MPLILLAPNAWGELYEQADETQLTKKTPNYWGFVTFISTYISCTATKNATTRLPLLSPPPDEPYALSIQYDNGPHDVVLFLCNWLYRVNILHGVSLTLFCLWWAYSMQVLDLILQIHTFCLPSVKVHLSQLNWAHLKTQTLKWLTSRESCLFPFILSTYAPVLGLV